ncbi:hypothetical protein [Paenibacillus sp. P32E]|uniref:hypothetical protein n=1 Tax=Paenibacillus sp. P32E TaxID=1349434 RepID=UPI00093EA891|nr:hypothetical protein [Paenibacillus sp. P32E]OKP91310.1 hypothetical protein A3848_09385 [Paenibacillus sp. P32E]
MTMKAYEASKALDAGHRKFVLVHSPEVVEVLDYGPTWVRYTASYIKLFISTNMRLFAAMVDHVHIEKRPDSASGQ